MRFVSSWIGSIRHESLDASLLESVVRFHLHLHLEEPSRRSTDERPFFS